MHGERRGEMKNKSYMLYYPENKNSIINILLENIFSNNKDFSSYKKLEDNYKNNVEKIKLKLQKDT